MDRASDVDNTVMKAKRHAQPQDYGLDTESLRAAHDAIAERITRTHGITIEHCDLPHPLTGNFDGARIHISNRADSEMAVFLLAHLFGHCVQWNTSEDKRALGLLTVDPGMPDPAFLQRVHDYEEEAGRLGLQLFHECGVTGLDQWLSDWIAADWHYLSDVYSGRIIPDPFDRFRERYLQFGAPTLQPMAIPKFEVRQWPMRSAF